MNNDQLLSLRNRLGAQCVKADPESCWPWTGACDRYGYGTIYAWRDTSTKKSFVWRTHRAAYFLAYGPIEEGQKVLHKCDNPPCCNPAHLYLGSDADNGRDKAMRGRAAHHTGALNGRSKLTPAQVDEIRTLYVPYRYTQRMLAERFGVTREQIDRIVNNRQWAA